MGPLQNVSSQSKSLREQNFHQDPCLPQADPKHIIPLVMLICGVPMEGLELFLHLSPSPHCQLIKGCDLIFDSQSLSIMPDA